MNQHQTVTDSQRKNQELLAKTIRAGGRGKDPRVHGRRWKVTMTKDDKMLLVYPLGADEAAATARALEIYPKWTVKSVVLGRPG